MSQQMRSSEATILPPSYSSHDIFFQPNYSASGYSFHGASPPPIESDYLLYDPQSSAPPDTSPLTTIKQISPSTDDKQLVPTAPSLDELICDNNIQVLSPSSSPSTHAANNAIVISSKTQPRSKSEGTLPQFLQFALFAQPHPSPTTPQQHQQQPPQQQISLLSLLLVILSSPILLISMIIAHVRRIFIQGLSPTSTRSATHINNIHVLYNAIKKKVSNALHQAQFQLKYSLWRVQTAQIKKRNKSWGVWLKNKEHKPLPPEPTPISPPYTLTPLETDVLNSIGFNAGQDSASPLFFDIFKHQRIMMKQEQQVDNTILTTLIVFVFLLVFFRFFLFLSLVVLVSTVVMLCVFLYLFISLVFVKKR